MAPPIGRPSRGPDVDELVEGRSLSTWSMRRQVETAVETAATVKTRLSDIFGVHHKSFVCVHFPDRASWLLLALEALSWRVTGTILGTDASVRLIGCLLRAIIKSNANLMRT
jgi:hypothetical protein